MQFSLSSAYIYLLIVSVKLMGRPSGDISPGKFGILCILCPGTAEIPPRERCLHSTASDQIDLV